LKTAGGNLDLGGKADYNTLKASLRLPPLFLRNIYLVVAYAENGDLRREGNLVGMTEDRARDFLVVPVLQALSLLHKEGIVHRDLKPENCLVDKDNCLLLADFGLSMYSGVGREGESGTPSDDDASPRTSDGTSESPDKLDSIASAALLEERAAACSILASVAAGTPLYTAPEVLFCMFQNQPMNEAVQPKNDVWALGVMLLEVLTGIHPFSPDACASGQSNNVMHNIAHTKSVSLPAFLSPMIADFLSLALKRDPHLRPSAAELLQHPWITSPVRQVQKVRPGSMSSLRLPSTCGTPSSHSSDHCSHEDDEEEPPVLSCAHRISQMQSLVDPSSGPASHRRIVTVAFEGQECWED